MSSQQRNYIQIDEKLTIVEPLTMLVTLIGEIALDFL